MTQSTELVGTAYHEAGHVIALRDKSVVADWVEVTKESSGLTECGTADFDSMADKEVFVIALAGIYAESRVRPDRTVDEFIKIIMGGSSDRNIVDSVFRKRRMAATTLSYQVAHGSAERFVKRNWDQIETVAKALLTKCESGLPARLNRDEIEQAIAA